MSAQDVVGDPVIPMRNCAASLACKALGGRQHPQHIVTKRHRRRAGIDLLVHLDEPVGMTSCPLLGHGRGRGDQNPSPSIHDVGDGAIGIDRTVPIHEVLG